MRVAVIGGGIQGTSVALELATRGIEVDLIEANSVLMEGASRHNEGKIHLGFVYANDPSLRTAELMFRGAARFGPLMRRWLGGSFESIPVSTPFNYGVHRDSLLTPDQLEEVYRAISAKIRVAGGNGSYFGVDDPHVVERLAGSDARYGPSVEAVFTTREVAIHPGRLADLITKTVSNCEAIRVVVDTLVTSISAIDRRVEVSTGPGAASNLGPYDHVINCAWGGRPALDRTAGLHFQGPWTFRMKYFLSATAPPRTAVLPSTTVVLGGFGDLVDYGTGEYYLSWYPSGRLGWSTDLAPPAWPTRPDAAKATEIANGTLHHLESVIPGVGELRTRDGEGLDVHGGLIYSLGNTDVDNPTSEFHRRSDIGPRSVGGYHSMDTGKYTTAPLFAMQVADRVTETG